jgi:hypothetical protein
MLFQNAKGIGNTFRRAFGQESRNEFEETSDSGRGTARFGKEKAAGEGQSSEE